MKTIKLSLILGGIALASACMRDISDGVDVAAGVVVFDYKAPEGFKTAMQAAASAVSVTLNFIPDSGDNSEAQLDTSHTNLALRFGAALHSGGTITVKHLVRGFASVLASPSDTITNITTADLQKIAFGNGDGGAGILPSGCSNTIGGHTFTLYRAGDRDFSSEVIRDHYAVTETGAFDWCPGTVRIFLNGGSLAADKLDINGNTQFVSLVTVCVGLSTVKDCLDAEGAVSGHLAIAPLTSVAHAKLLTVASTSVSAATVRNGAYPIATFGSGVRDSNIIDTAMTNIWNWSVGSGKSTFEAAMVNQGLIACDPLQALNCL